MDPIFSQTASVPEVSVNFLAIAVVTVVAMFIGWIWYERIFAKQWTKLIKLNKKKQQENIKKSTFVMLVLTIVQAFILSHFIVYANYFYPSMSGIGLGAITGFWTFVGFAFPYVVASNMFAMRRDELTKIEAGNQLVTLLVMGAILGAWLG